MNTLETYLEEVGLPRDVAMNMLQDHGIISDNCVWPEDVAEVDCPRAIAFLKETKLV